MTPPELWSMQDILNWLGISERMFRRRYMVHPDWPPSVTPPLIPMKDRRWYAVEVQQAVDKMRKHWRKVA